MKYTIFNYSIARNLFLLVLSLCLIAVDLLGQEGRGTTFRRSNDELIVINRTEIIQADEIVRNAVVIGGDIQVDGRIASDLIVVGGSVTLNGEIGGDLVLIGGKLISGPDALVNRRGTLIGGPFEIASRGTFDDDLFQFPLPGLFSFLSGIKLWVGHCVILMRPFAPGVAWTMVLAGLLMLINFLMLILLGNVVDQSVKILAPKPISAFFVGLLGLILLGPLLVLVTATGIGVLLVPFVLCAIVAAIVVGKVAVYTTLGQKIGQRAGAQWGNASIPAFLVGSLLMLFIYMVPFLGGLALGVVVPLAFGSILLAGINMFRTEVDFPTPKPGKPLVMKPTPGTKSTVSGHKATQSQNVAEGQAKSDLVDASGGSDHDPKKESSPDAGSQAFRASSGLENHYERAGFWARVVATALDFILVFIGLQILGLIDGHGGFRRFVFLWMVYHIVLWGWKGTTIGGIIMKLRLVSINGEPLSWGTAVIRSLSSLFSFIALGLGFLWVGWNEERQSWHDLVAGTVIIKTPQDAPAFA